jgi:hypothetical protein
LCVWLCACVRACVHACVRVCVCVRVWLWGCEEHLLHVFIRVCIRGCGSAYRHHSFIPAKNVDNKSYIPAFCLQSGCFAAVKLRE